MEATVRDSLIMKVVVVDLKVGNIRSITSALAFLSAPFDVTSDGRALEFATHVILPGVSSFDTAMLSVHELELIPTLCNYVISTGKPLLGICSGMQILTQSSAEGQLAGLGFIDSTCVRLEPDSHFGRKVPNVGFATITGFKPEGLFAELGTTADFYFTHSYAAIPWSNNADTNLAQSQHSVPFVAAFQQGNLCGTQFHPEKSQSQGLRVLSNFLSLG